MKAWIARDKSGNALLASTISMKQCADAAARILYVATGSAVATLWPECAESIVLGPVEPGNPTFNPSVWIYEVETEDAQDSPVTFSNARYMWGRRN